MPRKRLESFLIKTASLFIMLFVNLQAQDRSAVYATNIEASKPAAYIFEVAFNSELLPTSRIEINFPKAFNTNTVMMAVSEKLEGHLETTAQANTVAIRRSGAESTVAAGDTIDIKIASVINPAQIEQEWEFAFILLADQVEIERKNVRSRIVLYTK